MILIALGANLPSSAGEPVETLRAALAALERNGIIPMKVSPLYKSPAWPHASDPPFANAVAEVRSILSPAALMNRLHQIERLFGRTRGERNAPRPLDLDILDYDGLVQSGPPILPHPRLETRAFVLLPLSQIAPNWHHPVTGRSVSQLLAAVETMEVERMELLPEA
jgi:2-amino-4-hydroxy-6-hydroxymethyldihydropteridine diphosphokinase